MNKITTKHGDEGQTDLLGRMRVSKTDCRIEANGEVDELLALLGMVKCQVAMSAADVQRIEHIQVALMAVMKHVAASGQTDVAALESMMVDMEQAIDSRQAPFSFVLPGSSEAEAWIQMARAKARTVERRLWAVSAHFHLSPVVMRFANRLSDYLFVLASQV